MPLAARRVAAVEVRVFTGYAHERAEHLGVAQVVEEAIDKGTVRRDGRALNDAFDEIGATHSSFAGRETIGFSSLVLPEYLERTIALHAEMIRTPTFPDDACAVAVELSRQSLAALQDDPGELAKKLLHTQAYGEPLGRHVLGEPATLERIGRGEIVEHWSHHFAAARMLVAVAGPVDPAAVADQLERAFEGFGPPPAPGAAREAFPFVFRPGRSHHPKELEQEQIAICFPGASVTDPDFPVECVATAVLAGGMSGRLFTEVREKQGLVYWVGAWGDQPRVGGMVHLGASTTPQNVDRTYATLLREIARLGEDLTVEEVQRAIAGILTRRRTRGDVTRARAAELADDLFYYGRPVPTEEKVAWISAVTVERVREYLEAHPRDRLGVVTLGPRELAA